MIVSRQKAPATDNLMTRRLYATIQVCTQLKTVTLSRRLSACPALIRIRSSRAGSEGTGSRESEKEAPMSKQKNTSSGEERSMLFRLAMIGTAIGLLLAVAI